MDFESPDEIDRTFAKRPGSAKRVETFEAATPQRKTPKVDDVYHKEPPPYDSYINPETLTDSECGSEYEQPANNAESSMDGSEDSESDYEEHRGGFQRLDPSKKKQLIIKDGKIMKTDKLKGNEMAHFKISPKGNANRTKRMTITKTSAGPFQTMKMGDHFDNAAPPSPKAKDGFRVNGIKPIDVAAHLKLLGESLTIIGERLKEHEGQIAVSGSLSVLLDSMLCSLAPLLCLTQLIPELQENCCSPEQLSNTLDNVAFIMPGL